MALQTSLYKIVKQKYKIDVEIKGCWFHFNQAIIKRVISLGLLGLYCNNFQVMTWFRRFGALALVPLDCIQKCWDIILNEIPSNISLHARESIFEFLNYFSNTWLLGKHGAPPETWNVSEEDNRTNNIVEGHHSKRTSLSFKDFKSDSLFQRTF